MLHRYFRCKSLVFKMKIKQIINCVALGQCELLLCGDCVGLVPGMHFISVWVFGITYCNAHFLKP